MQKSFKVDYTVTLGTKTLSEYKDAFKEREVNGHKNRIDSLHAGFLIDKITVTEKPTEVDLVFLTLDELGVHISIGWGYQKELYERAHLLGLEKAPAEAALVLGLEVGRIKKFFERAATVRVCMEPLLAPAFRVEGEVPHQFYFSRDVGGLVRLDRQTCGDCINGMVWCNDYYVFCKPRKTE
jgi:hypothetical protein